MIKNLIITIEALAILGLAVFVYYTCYQNKASKTGQFSEGRSSTEVKIVRFPEIKLAADERITGAEMSFQTAHIKSISGIPPGWDADIDLDAPPNPKFKGSILVGVAALGSSNELPEFEIDSYSKGIEPKVLKAVFTIAKYPGNPDDTRRVEILMNRP